MNTSDYLRLLRRRWPIIAAFAILGALLASLLTYLQTPQYSSRASVFFTVQAAESVSDLAQGSSYTTNQVQSFAQIASTPLVLSQVIKQRKLDETPAQLASRVKVTVPSKTAIVAIQVEDPDAKKAAGVANAIAKQLVTAVGTLSPTDSSGQARVKATVVTPAVRSSSPSSPSWPMNVAIGLLAGLLLGWCSAVVRDRMDTRLRTVGDLEHIISSPVVGTIPLDSDRENHPNLMSNDPTSQGAEAFRRLRTNLRFLAVDKQSNVYTVTSSVQGEGKSSTVSNLALAMAEAGQRVLVVDTDLRRPRVDDHFGVSGGVGLTNVLIGEAALDDVIQEGSHENLAVLAAGRIPPNPSELLGSDEMRQVIEQARGEYDAVLLDAPPLLPVTDSTLLARLTGGVVLVVSLNQVRREQVKGSLDSLQAVDVPVLGVIINGVDKRSDAYGYGYGYGKYTADSAKQRRAKSRSRRASGEATKTGEAPRRTTTSAGSEGSLPTGQMADEAQLADSVS